jgi:endoglucanase
MIYCMKRCWFIGIALLNLASADSGTAADKEFNYAGALQKCLFFYEAQQSGVLSPNNRVEWRGPACLTDGQDIGRDLSGGWFDAGDHWTANLTMSFAAMTLAWSAIEQPDGWLKTGQMDELLESLIHVNRYFLKCVLNPDCKDPATELEVAIGCGGREGVEGPNVHAMWASAEVAHLMTKRPTFRLNKQTPGGDIPGAMAAAMAASSMVIRENTSALKGKKGYDDFNGAAFADLLLDRAEKLLLFARANSGPVVTDKLPKVEQDAIRKQRREALRADGKVVEIGYRADPFDKVFTAATFLQRAHLAKNPQFGAKWLDFANTIYENEYKAENNHDWWKDYGAGGFGKVGAYNMMRLAPGEEKFHAELQLYCCRFCEYKATPGGLRMREWFAHEYGSLRHANNAAVIALYYSEHVEKAPQIQGNTWWKGGKSTTQLREMFEREGRRPVDYALGANPYGRSYLVGFGNQPFNNVHHRGAYGAWAGFEHFIPGMADDRNTSRHILYGALVAGPDHNDVFLCGKEHLRWLAVPGTKEQDFFYQFPNRAEPVRKQDYQWNATDLPFQDVMDSQFNEVALDYNAGFTANLAWLCAHGFSAGKSLPDGEFPPKPLRNDSLDLLSTDREFFVAAKLVSNAANATDIEATLWNRSRCPARVSTNLSLRFFFTLDGDTKLAQVQATVSGSDKATVSAAQMLAGKTAYIEVSFPGDAIYPGNIKAASRTVRLRLTAPAWSESNDWSSSGLDEKTKLQPRLAVYEAGRRVGGEEPSRDQQP